MPKGKIIEGWDRWNLNALISLLQEGTAAASVKCVE